MSNSFITRFLIVDDHPVMRRGLKDTLESEPGYEVVAQFERAEEVVDIMDSLDVDLMLVDVSLPGMNGIELVKNVIFQKPGQKILVISRHEEALYAERALRAGAKGYIMKFETSETLLKAIKKVLNGGLYVSEGLNEKLLLSVMQGKKEASGLPVDILSDREMEVFELIGRGKCSSEIAGQLHLASKTVETYRSRIKEKLDFKNTTEMIYYAVKWAGDDPTDNNYSSRPQ